MKKEKHLTWKVQDIGVFLKNSAKAVLKGEFLLRLNVSRYFIHIVYTFFLFAMTIWISMMIENTMTQVEHNKKVLKELSIANSQKTFDVVSLSSRASIDNLLKESGSVVTEPEKPATMLRK